MFIFPPTRYHTSSEIEQFLQPGPLRHTTHAVHTNTVTNGGYSQRLHQRGQCLPWESVPAVTQSAQDSGTSARHISHVIRESEVLVKSNPKIFHSGRSYDIGTHEVDGNRRKITEILFCSNDD